MLLLILLKIGFVYLICAFVAFYISRFNLVYITEVYITEVYDTVICKEEILYIKIANLVLLYFYYLGYYIHILLIGFIW